MALRNEKSNIVSFSPGFTPITNEAAIAFNRKALSLGIVAGLRSMMPFALLAWSKEQAKAPSEDAVSDNPSKLALLTSVTALGELIGDKLPTTPSRLETGPFVGRLAIGAIAGALLSQRYDQPILSGAVRGAVGAGLGTIAGYSVRQLLSHTVIPDFLVATIEDGVALSLGLQAVKSPLAE